MAFFTELPEKRIDVDCNGGEITSDTGLLFLREMEKRIGIIDRITRVIIDTRH